MFVVLVRHYLTEEGKKYFIEEWFPAVKNIISQKRGYASIDYVEEGNECLFITIDFIDRESFMAWNADSVHSVVIDKLDRFRSRDYWESTHNEKPGFSFSEPFWDRNQL